MATAPEEGSRREGRPLPGAVGLLMALYFLTRLWSLSALPMFLDEAVHLQWAERLYGEGRILRPVGAGRLLAVAAYGLALPFGDRLEMARLIATTVGGITLLLTMLLSHRLFGARASVAAGLLYILSPFALVYDRLALSDGFLSAAVTGLMLATWTLIQGPGGRSAHVWFATLIVLAVLSKVSALLFFLTVPLGVLALGKGRAVLWSLAGASAIGLLCVSPMLWFFVTNGGEIAAQHVADPAILGETIASTLRDMGGWVHSYFTAPTLLFALISLFVLRDGRAAWLFGSVAAPFILLAAFSRPWSARYVLPTLPPLLILVAGGITTLSDRLKPIPRAILTGGLILAASLTAISFDHTLLSDPSLAPFPQDDRRQLVTGWPAGYGIRDLSARLKQEAGEAPLTAFVDTAGTRTVPTSLAILLAGDTSVRLVEGDFDSAAFRASMVEELRTRRVFAILGPRPSTLNLPSLFQGVKAERVEIYGRPGGEWAASLFRLVAAPG